MYGNIGVWSRVMQFCAGPQEVTFYVCEAHRPYLDSGNVCTVFFITEDEPVRPVDPAEGNLCEICEGDG